MMDTLELEREITDSAAAFVAGQAGPARARLRHDAPPATPEMESWRGMAELGWFGIAAPEAQGGLELGAPAVCLVAEQAGRGLLMPPLTTAMAAAPLLAATGSSDAVGLLDALLSGCRHVALADGLDFVPDADLADAIVCGRGQGADFELRLIPAGPGVLALDRAVDGSWLGRIAETAWAGAPRLMHGEAGLAAWRQARSLLRLGDAAYLCGLMSAALDLALDYLKLRRQFGVPIGSFQALQHRAADGHIARSAACALVGEAARAFGTPRQDFAAAAAVRRASAAALQLTQETVQFHGAIGFADEHDAGLYLRRAMVLAARHGAALADAVREPRAG